MLSRDNDTNSVSDLNGNLMVVDEQDYETVYFIKFNIVVNITTLFIVFLWLPTPVTFASQNTFLSLASCAEFEHQILRTSVSLPQALLSFPSCACRSWFSGYSSASHHTVVSKQ